MAKDEAVAVDWTPDVVFDELDDQQVADVFTAIIEKYAPSKVSFKVARDAANAKAKAHRSVEVPFSVARMWDTIGALVDDSVATWTVKCQTHLRKNWGDVKKLNATALAFRSGSKARPVVVLPKDSDSEIVKSLTAQGITVVLEK